MSSAAVPASPLLVCPVCRASWPLAPMFFGCPVCAATGLAIALEVAYDFASLAGSLDDDGPVGMWRDAPLLPPIEPASRVSLGEGGTPLVPAARVAAAAGIEHVLVKLEGTNPTGAFKDRLNSVSVSMARQFGYRRVVCTSTGNHGVSLAAYAAAAGLECLVICTGDPEPLAVRQMRLHGARVAVFEGSAEQSRAWVARLVAGEGWWPSTRNHPRPYANPFGPEGYKTIAFEIWRQLGRRVPSRVLVPTGGGDSIAGIAKGFRELRSLGLTDHLPILVACQAAAAAPLVRAWEARAPTVSPVVAAPSIAVSIAEDSTGDHALRALGDGGLAVAVEEDRIAAAVALLGRDGFCVEPASAVSAAGLLCLASEGQVRRGETVVCIATASGIRWSATFAGVDGTPEVIAPSALTRSG